jgi:tRNA modification GTPase
MNDTIYALATAAGRSAVAVVRVSGPETRVVLDRIGASRLRPRRAALRRLRSARGETLDQALVLWFPGPGSYTGEDSAEFHLHGGSAVVDAVMSALGSLGPRLAGPGEFTRRAFENGKLDLGQAEAVADLVDAETLGQARQAIAQLEGALGARYRAWRERLVAILAGLEAAVDFPDEAIPSDVARLAEAPLLALIADLDAALKDGSRGQRVREGYRVAIIGAPNAGKSTLLNALTGRDMAIVTPMAGTTRDVIEASVVWDGYAVILADMAGLRDAGDAIEREGVRRARIWAEAADLRIWVIDRASADAGWREVLALVRPGDLALANKADVAAGTEGLLAIAAAGDRGLAVRTVSLTGGDVDGPGDWLRARVSRDLAGADFPATTRARHAEHLAMARDHLARAVGVLAQPELAVEDVRLATRRLAVVTGRFGVEEVLDRVFANFCIGK